MVSAAASADPPAYFRARAVASYSGRMRDLIHAFKFSDRHDCRRLFGRWLAEAGKDLIADADLVVPVPLNRWRLLSRRYNQSAILAKELARQTGLTYAPSILHRAKRTTSQVGLTRRQRQDNVLGAFTVANSSPSAIKGRNVLLIDDVITTGATANACARVLLRAGATRVDTLALALVTDTAHVPL